MSAGSAAGASADDDVAMACGEREREWERDPHGMDMVLTVA